jgi:hypothetical protein
MADRECSNLAAFVLQIFTIDFFPPAIIEANTKPLSTWIEGFHDTLGTIPSMLCRQTMEKNLVVDLEIRRVYIVQVGVGAFC